MSLTYESLQSFASARLTLTRFSFFILRIESTFHKGYCGYPSHFLTRVPLNRYGGKRIVHDRIAKIIAIQAGHHFAGHDFLPHYIYSADRPHNSRTVKTRRLK